MQLMILGLVGLAACSDKGDDSGTTGVPDLVYTDDNLPTHYSFKSGYGVRRAEALYRAVLEAGRDKYLEKINRERTPEEEKARAKGMEFEVKRLIGLLDDQGRWLGKDRKIYTNIFIRNMNRLSAYAKLVRELQRSAQ